jgi:branched-chain amino acid transport system permease protein
VSKIVFSKRLLATAVGIVCLSIFPLVFTSGYVIHIANMILIWSMICLSLNIIFGYAGQLSLAHGALFGTGGYIYAILATKFGMSFWLILPISGLAAAVIGLLIGIPSLRLKGPYFVIVTLGFNVILVAIIENLGDLTGGVIGMMGIPFLQSIRGPFFEIDMSSKVSCYYLMLFFLILFWIASYVIKTSLMGRSLIAIKEDEDFCRSLGINTMSMKLQSFVLSSFLAGLAGVLYAGYMGIITPHDASFHVGFDALVYLSVGGIGTIIGTIIGPGIMIILSEAMQGLMEMRQIFNGLALVLLIIFMPKGIAGAFQILWKRFPNIRKRDDLA